MDRASIKQIEDLCEQREAKRDMSPEEIAELMVMYNYLARTIEEESVDREDESFKYFVKAADTGYKLVATHPEYSPMAIMASIKCGAYCKRHDRDGEKYFNRALEIIESPAIQNDPHRLAEAYFNLGNAYVFSDLDAATKYLKKSVDIAAPLLLDGDNSLEEIFMLSSEILINQYDRSGDAAAAEEMERLAEQIEMKFD